MRTHLAVLLIVAVTAASCSSPGDSAAEPTGTTVAVTSSALAPTTSPSTTATPTSPPSTSAPTTVAPTTTVPPVGFEHPCVERAPTRAPASVDETTLDRFGPIGPAPSIDVELPLGRGERSTERGVTTAETLRIPGGVLVNVRARSDDFFDGSILAAIDADGVVRWVRCFDTLVRVVLAPASAGPTKALIGSEWSTLLDARPGRSDVISLADGTITGSLVDVLEASGVEREPGTAMNWIASGGPTLIIGAEGSHVVDASNDHLTRVDLTSMTAGAIPYPPDVDSRPVSEMALGIGRDGRIVSMQTNSADGHPIATAALTDDQWLTDASAVLDAGQTTIGSGFSVPLRLLDPAGQVVWERPDVVLVSPEFFQGAIDGDVVVARSCEADANPCEARRLGGYDIRTGATVWQIDGSNDVSVIGDGHAIVAARSADGSVVTWTMIDTATGQLADDSQQWSDPELFANETLGGWEYSNVARDGGVVLTLEQGHVAIWYPTALSHPTIAVEL